MDLLRRIAVDQRAAIIAVTHDIPAFATAERDRFC
jgi:ABC-type lipoprotein export system ATPase subunit